MICLKDQHCPACVEDVRDMHRQGFTTYRGVCCRCSAPILPGRNELSTTIGRGDILEGVRLIKASAPPVEPPAEPPPEPLPEPDWGNYHAEPRPLAPYAARLVPPRRTPQEPE